jgi:dolichyl-phosphate-mannose--protein O-mannosyl transferase
MVIHLIVLKVTRQKDTVQVGDFSLGMLLFISFLAQYLPWALVPRGTYIYHYFPSVPFIILCVCYGLFVLSKYKEKPATIISRTLILLSFVVFIFLFPYVSGLRMPTWFMDIAKVIPGIWY